MQHFEIEQPPMNNNMNMNNMNINNQNPLNLENSFVANLNQNLINNQKNLEDPVNKLSKINLSSQELLKLFDGFQFEITSDQFKAC